MSTGMELIMARGVVAGLSEKEQEDVRKAKRLIEEAVDLARHRAGHGATIMALTILTLEVANE